MHADADGCVALDATLERIRRRCACGLDFGTDISDSWTMQFLYYTCSRNSLAQSSKVTFVTAMRVCIWRWTPAINYVTLSVMQLLLAGSLGDVGMLFFLVILCFRSSESVASATWWFLGDSL